MCAVRPVSLVSDCCMWDTGLSPSLSDPTSSHKSRPKHPLWSSHCVPQEDSQTEWQDLISLQQGGLEGKRHIRHIHAFKTHMCRCSWLQNGQEIRSVSYSLCMNELKNVSITELSLIFLFVQNVTFHTKHKRLAYSKDGMKILRCRCSLMETHLCADRALKAKY